MYRALAWLALQRGADPQDEESVGPLAEEGPLSVDGARDLGIVVDGVRLEAQLRGPQVDLAASLVARLPRVRSAMVARQQEIAREGAIVVVGRDIGTVVLPDADVKLYLEASAQERAKRRYSELCASGADAGYAQVLRDLEERDALDTKRAHSPLTPAADAVVLHTDGLTVDGVVDKVLQIIEAERWE